MLIGIGDWRAGSNWTFTYLSLKDLLLDPNLPKMLVPCRLKEFLDPFHVTLPPVELVFEEEPFTQSCLGPRSIRSSSL
jgi:hypothetical protein